MPRRKHLVAFALDAESSRFRDEEDGLVAIARVVELDLRVNILGNK